MTEDHITFNGINIQLKTDEVQIDVYVNYALLLSMPYDEEMYKAIKMGVARAMFTNNGVQYITNYTGR